MVLLIVWEVHSSENLFNTKEEAQIRADELAETQKKETVEYWARINGDKKKSGRTKPTYEQRRIKDLEKEIKRLEKEKLAEPLW